MGERSESFEAQQGLAGFLRGQSKAIMAEWEQRARKFGTATRLPRPWLIDSIPGFLARIADLVDKSAAGQPSELFPEESERHALDRLQEGFDLSEVVCELSMLRDCILSLWSGGNGVGRVRGAEQRLLDQVLDRAILGMVDRYGEARDRMLVVMDEISSTALEAKSLDELLGKLAGAFAREMRSVDATVILLREGDRLVVRAASGQTEAPGFSVRVGQGFAGKVAAERRSVQSSPAAAELLLQDGVIRPDGIRALYGVPLMDCRELIGVAQMGSVTAEEFSREDRVLFASMTAHAVAGIRLHMLRDRADRRAQELAESERKFRATFENAAAGIAHLALDGRWLRVNKKYCEILGYPEEELMGLTLAEVTHPDDVEQDRANLDRLVRGVVHECAMEKRYLHKSGRVVWVNLVASLVRDASGEPAYAIAVVEDITSQRELRQQVEFLSRASDILGSTLNLEQTLDDLARLAVSAIADWCGVDITDASGKFGDYVAIAHRDPAQIEVVRELRRRFPPRFVPPIGEAEVIATGTPQLVREVEPVRMREYAIDESHFELLEKLNLHSLLVVPLLQRGRVIGAMSLAMAESARSFGEKDLELAQELARRASVAIENARLHDESERAVRLREQILAIVSHDLRNPIGTIDLAGTLLEQNEGIQKNPSARRQVKAIQRSASRAARLIDDLLDVASMQAGTLALELSNCRLRTILKESIEVYEPRAKKARIQLNWELPAATHHARCDRDRLLQVLSNLIGNALKFCSPGDAITLRAEVRERDAVISVVDTGPGIAAEEVEHIFDVYWKGRAKEQGTGLGLFISKGIIESHGGRLWVESEPGQGSAFSFTLPLSAAPSP